MKNKFLLFSVKDIISNPIKAWETIDSEYKSVISTRNGFLLPLIVLVSFSAMAGSLIYTNSELSPVYSIFEGIKCFILFYFSVYASAYMVTKITYPLDLGKNFESAFRLIVYSMVPLFICQLFSRFFESLLFINILSLYGLYIFWTGAEKMFNPPAYKKMPLLISSAVIFVVIFVGTEYILTKLTDKIFHAFFS
jgi:hypothetical protein